MGTSGLLRVPVHVKIRRRIPLSRQCLPLLVFASGPHQLHHVELVTLDEQLVAYIRGVDQLLRWQQRLVRQALLNVRQGPRIRLGADGRGDLCNQMQVVGFAGFTQMNFYPTHVVVRLRLKRASTS